MVFIGIAQLVLSAIQTAVFLLILGMVSVALSKSNGKSEEK